MLAAEVMLEVARGKDPAAEKRAERSKGPFGELAGPYVEEYAKRHNKSWRQADTLVRRHLLSRWGALQAASISRSDIKAMMTGIEAPVVANQTLAAASAIFSWAMRSWSPSIHAGASIVIRYAAANASSLTARCRGSGPRSMTPA